MFGARAIQRRREKEEELKVTKILLKFICLKIYFKIVQAQKANGPPPAFVRTAPSAVK